MHDRKYDTGMFNSEINFENILWFFYKILVEYQTKSYTKLKIMNMLFHEVLFEIHFFLSKRNLKLEFKFK